jgi:DNA polymerase III alpha subunit
MEFMGKIKSNELAEAKNGNYTVTGLIKTLLQVKDKDGNIMAFGTLQDSEGIINLVFFPTVWKKWKDIVKLDANVTLNGSIDPVNEHNSKMLSFNVSGMKEYETIKEMFEEEVLPWLQQMIE